MTTPTPKLRFGLWYAFRNPLKWRRSYQDVYTEILEQIVWAESIGSDDVWLTEHHFTEDGHALLHCLRLLALLPWVKDALT